MAKECVAVQFENLYTGWKNTSNHNGDLTLTQEKAAFEQKIETAEKEVDEERRFHNVTKEELSKLIKITPMMNHKANYL